MIAEAPTAEVDWAAVFAEIAANFGGSGSGDYGHAGRPGEIGGSGAGGLGAVPLSSNETDALDAYTGGSFVYINNAMRGIGRNQDMDPDRSRAWAKTIDAVMERSITKAPMTVFRGISKEAISKLTGISQYALGRLSSEQVGSALSTLKGVEYVDKGFASTSHDEDVAGHRVANSDHNARVVVEVRVPPGTKAIDVNATMIQALKARNDEEFGFKAEEEVLLDHGMRFHIDDVRPMTVFQSTGRLTDLPAWELIVHVVPQVKNAERARFGGAGSGDFGHAGRKGEAGGSAGGDRYAKAAADVSLAHSVKWGFEPAFSDDQHSYPATGPANGFTTQPRTYEKNDHTMYSATNIAAYDAAGKLVGTFSLANGGGMEGMFKISVRPDAQRQGYGFKLLAEAERQGIDLAAIAGQNHYTREGRALVTAYLRQRAES